MHEMVVPLGFAVLQLVPWFFAVFHRYSYGLGINDVHLQTTQYAALGAQLLRLQ